MPAEVSRGGAFFAGPYALETSTRGEMKNLPVVM